MSVEQEKQAAAEAAELVEDGMTVGLGTGTTVAYPLLPGTAVAQHPAVQRHRRARSGPADGACREHRPVRSDHWWRGPDRPNSWLVKGVAHQPARQRAHPRTPVSLDVLAHDAELGAAAG
jgi:hypothetical protein